MATDALLVLTGILERVCGDLITARQDAEGVTRLQVKISHSAPFKNAVRDYVAAYNREHGASVSVSFPRPFELRLRARQKSAR